MEMRDWINCHTFSVNHYPQVLFGLVGFHLVQRVFPDFFSHLGGIGLLEMNGIGGC